MVVLTLSTRPAQCWEIIAVERSIWYDQSQSIENPWKGKFVSIHRSYNDHSVLTPHPLRQNTSKPSSGHPTSASSIVQASSCPTSSPSKCRYASPLSHFLCSLLPPFLPPSIVTLTYSLPLPRICSEPLPHIWLESLPHIRSKPPHRTPNRS